jgi:DNA-binding beta-propeller fold protein YncE
VLVYAPDPDAPYIGMYLLNEGNMGSNKSTIDYLDFRTAIYARNIYAEKNPTVVKELGDVGNDIQLYNGRLYAVINCSHKVEVMDAYTGKRLASIDVPNCRYIRFKRDHAYVSAYVGPVAIDPNARQGAVFKINLDTYRIEDECTVGYQPDELEIIDNRLYVANSGGYRAPDYDNTVSVVEMESMRQLYKIEVAINLHRVKADAYKQLWVSSRGNYDDVPSNLYLLEGGSGRYRVTKTMNIPASNMALSGDSLYVYSVEYSNQTNKNVVTYAIVNVKERRVVSRKFITDGSELDIRIPYGIAIHPVTRDIYVTDAKNYVSSGALHCYGRDGARKWSVRTGDIPAHIAFLPKKN